MQHSRHEFAGGSLARDAGNNSMHPQTIKRGFSRLFDGDGNGSLIVDIGAFESGYIVTSFQDSVDAAPGDGVSVDSKGRSTLRAAIIEANARTGADTILLGTGVYTLSLFGLNENGALSGDLDITDDLTIIGAGSERTFIDADFLGPYLRDLPRRQCFHSRRDAREWKCHTCGDGECDSELRSLTLEDVTIENSLANRGGALFNNGIVAMTDSYFHSNTAMLTAEPSSITILVRSPSI